jgi:hypothetical protein
MTVRLMLALALLPSLASAAPAQLQIDGGLSVIGAGYERTVARDVALQGEAFVFGTYFLPWFDLGTDVKGGGIGMRLTIFTDDAQRGFYLAPYARACIVTGNETAETVGAFAGWIFGLSDKLDLRVGAGAQYMDGPGFNTGFIALDAVLGYRL